MGELSHSQQFDDHCKEKHCSLRLTMTWAHWSQIVY